MNGSQMKKEGSGTSGAKGTIANKKPNASRNVPMGHANQRHVMRSQLDLTGKDEQQS